MPSSSSGLQDRRSKPHAVTLQNPHTAGAGGDGRGIGELQGRVAIVTGAAQGIGRCIAETLASDGASVVIADIQDEKAGEVAVAIRASGGEADAIAVDVRDPARAEAMVAFALERYGADRPARERRRHRCAAGEAWTIDEDHWRAVIDTNLSGPWWCTKAVIPHMKEAREWPDRLHQLRERAHRRARHLGGVQREQGGPDRADGGAVGAPRAVRHPGKRGGARTDGDGPAA